VTAPLAQYSELDEGTTIGSSGWRPWSSISVTMASSKPISIQAEAVCRVPTTGELSFMNAKFEAKACTGKLSGAIDGYTGATSMRPSATADSTSVAATLPE